MQFGAFWDRPYPNVTPNPLIDYFSYIAILQTYGIVYLPNLLRIEKIVDHNKNFDYGAYWIWFDIQYAAQHFTYLSHSYYETLAV